MTRILVARLDNLGDLVLAGPAIRAAARHGAVTLLCGPSGAPIAPHLPGIDDVVVWDAPWTGFQPPPVDSKSVLGLVERLGERDLRSAAILTSFHQSPLPLALLCRMAGIEEIAAVGVDYPGSLLDHRVAYREELHEVEQALAVTDALGYAPPPDDGLALNSSKGRPSLPPDYVVLHAGASVPARRIPLPASRDAVLRMSERGHAVVLTGTSNERRIPLGERASGAVVDLRGETSIEQLIDVIAHAAVVVVGNSGPAHIAAATGTPVVSIFAPVVPHHRWRPWRVESVLLGDQAIPCSGCRARRCPLSSQACVSSITGAQIADAVDAIARVDQRGTARLTPGQAPTRMSLERGCEMDSVPVEVSV